MLIFIYLFDVSFNVPSVVCFVIHRAKSMAHELTWMI